MIILFLVILYQDVPPFMCVLLNLAYVIIAYIQKRAFSRADRGGA